MKRHIVLVQMIVLIILVLSGCTAKQPGLADHSEYKYNMYIGLNDKDTYKQLISDDDAEKIVSEICLKYVDGYTVTKRQGVYKDEKGVVTKENSLDYEFYAATDEEMKKVMDEALLKLNQNSILIEKEKINYDFYEGVNKK